MDSDEFPGQTQDRLAGMEKSVLSCLPILNGLCLDQPEAGQRFLSQAAVAERQKL